MDFPVFNLGFSKLSSKLMSQMLCPRTEFFLYQRNVDLFNYLVLFVHSIFGLSLPNGISYPNLRFSYIIIGFSIFNLETSDLNLALSSNDVSFLHLFEFSIPTWLFYPIWIFPSQYWLSKPKLLRYFLSQLGFSNR